MTDATHSSNGTDIGHFGPSLELTRNSGQDLVSGLMFEIGSRLNQRLARGLIDDVAMRDDDPAQLRYCGPGAELLCELGRIFYKHETNRA